jgi:hypothetical protein
MHVGDERPTLTDQAIGDVLGVFICMEKNQMNDPAPILNPYRVVFFLATVLSALLALDSVPAEIKTYLVIALIVINAVMVVFFNVPNASRYNPSIATRISNKLSSK